MALHGTSKRYITERLQREGHTALFEAVQSGQITALTAAVELGWVQRPLLKGGSTHRAHRRDFELRAIAGELSPGGADGALVGPKSFRQLLRQPRGIGGGVADVPCRDYGPVGQPRQKAGRLL